MRSVFKQEIETNVYISCNSNKKITALTGFVLIMLFLTACSSSEKSVTAEQAIVEYDLLYTLPKEIISYNEKVRPVLESRCVVCHGCYDAPCQLKLSSPEGIHRGANKKKVYYHSYLLLLESQQKRITRGSIFGANGGSLLDAI